MQSSSACFDSIFIYYDIYLNKKDIFLYIFVIFVLFNLY